MYKKKKKIHVFIRQWIPRILPYRVTEEEIRQFVGRHHQEFSTFIYAGWRRRKDSQGVRRIGFFIGTGASRKEARDVFKEGMAFGKSIWEIFD